MIKLYFKYASMIIKSQMEYKKSFIISIVAQILTSFFSLVSIYFLFDKFGNVKGYSFADVAICYAVSFLGFSITECFFRGFDHFDRMLGNGVFDRIMITPKPLILQVLGHEMQLTKIGRMLVSIITFIILLCMNPGLITVEKMFTMLLMIIGTIIIYSSLFLLKAAICFFTVQSLEIMNIFTDGARDLTEYPLDIYKKSVLNFFTFIIPLAMVNLYPLQYIIGKSDNKLYMLAPLISLLFIIPCYSVWKIGVKKYQSTGS